MSKVLTFGGGGGLTLNSGSAVSANAALIPDLIGFSYSPALETRYSLGDNSLKAIAGLGVMGPLGFFGYPYARASAVYDTHDNLFTPGAEVGFLAPSAMDLFVGGTGLGLEIKATTNDIRDPMGSVGFMLYVTGNFSLYRCPPDVCYAD